MGTQTPLPDAERAAKAAARKARERREFWKAILVTVISGVAVVVIVKKLAK